MTITRGLVPRKCRSRENRGYVAF